MFPDIRIRTSTVIRNYVTRQAEPEDDVTKLLELGDSLNMKLDFIQFDSLSRIGGIRKAVITSTVENQYEIITRTLRSCIWRVYENRNKLTRAPKDGAPEN